MSIKLNDILHFPTNEISNIKIKFNIPENGVNPLDLFQTNPEEINTQWLFWREKQSYFAEGQIAICFARIDGDNWLLTTIKRVTKDLGVYQGVAFDGVELDEYKKYFGRVIVKYHNKSKSMGRYFTTICDELIVNQILPYSFDGYDFPGYDNVRLSYEQLSLIISQHKRDWVSALENQKAVYLITDNKTGKLYVGSATSANGMLLQRWSEYAANGHGGNILLKKLVDEQGFDYIKNNFQYSILENYNAKVDDSIIFKRESWWKETLQSRNFGYNAN